MIALFADENFPQPAVETLRALGYDVLTMHQLGLTEQAVPDEQVLAEAGRLNRCLLTLNRRDFIKLHRLYPDHAGIIVCTFEPDFSALANRIAECLNQHSGSYKNQLLRVQREPR